MASKTTSKSLPAARCVRQNIICVEPRSHISHSAEGLCIQRRSAPSLPAAMLPALITACIFRQNHGDSTVTVRLQSYGDSTVIERLQHGPCMVPARSLHGPCTVIAKFGPSAVTVMARSQYGAVTVRYWHGDRPLYMVLVRYLFGPCMVCDRCSPGLSPVAASLHGCC